MQVGDGTINVRIVVSTIAEAEHLLDYLVDCRNGGKNLNVCPFLRGSSYFASTLKPCKILQVLYGIPLPPSQVPRLARIAKTLGPGSISVLVDDPSQLSAANTFKELTGHPLQIFVKVDTGYHRAGLAAKTTAFKNLIQAINELEPNEIGELTGFYCHAGHSYGSDSSLSARKLLIEEIKGLRVAASEADAIRASKNPISKCTLSVGASPTATSIKDLAQQSQEPTAQKLQRLIATVKDSYRLEIHAGVYAFLDMQQLATRASLTNVAHFGGPRLSEHLADVALSIMVEVASVYESRNEPEALIAAGTLALGREPCKSYDGWGIVSDWGMKTTDSAGECGWKVGRISQEHSVLTRHDDRNERGYQVLHVGQKLRIWPNHACVASAGFSWYLVVDSSLPGSRQNEVVDVWVRCREW